MNLHEDKFAFLNIINLVHEDSGIRSDILEKDYYVTLLLRELAGKQAELPAYFKGGTALYIEMPCATLADWRYSPFWMEVLEYIKCRSRQAIRSARSAASVERIS